MKTRTLRALLAVLMLAALLPLKATHNRSGEILYKRIMPYYNASGYQVYTYSITLISYTDDGQNVADRCVDTVYFGDGAKAAVSRSNGVTTGCSCGSSVGCGEIIINNPGYRVKKNIYSITHTYSGLGTYIVSFSDPNRNAGIVNIPNSVAVPFYIESEIVINSLSAINSSPVLTNPPTDMGVINACFYHSPAAFDADGDSLSFELAIPKGSGGQPVTGFTFPGNIALDPYGLLSWCSPQAVGEYNIAMIIKEWRKPACNGSYQLIGYVTRDMQMLISGGQATPFPTLALSDTCIAAGTILHKTFNTGNPGNVSVNVYGAPFMSQPAAAITPSTGPATANTTFSWQPGCEMIRKNPHQVTIAYTTNSTANTRAYRQFNVKVVPPTVRIQTVVKDTGVVTIRWKKINCQGNIINYNVYRKIGTNNWFHTPCQEGVPASSGFQLIGYTQLTDTFFIDTYLSLFPNGSTGNYLVTAVTNDCAESFADSIRTFAIITGIEQLQLDPASVSISPNPFQDKLEVVISNTHITDLQVSLFTIDGRLVYESTEKINGNKFTLQGMNLKAGVYLVYLKTNTGVIYKKIVKE